MAMPREERNQRARRRYALKHGGAIVEKPAPKDGKLHTSLLGFVAEKKPLVVTEVVTKTEWAKMTNAPTEPRKRRQKKSATPEPPKKNQQPGLYDGVE
ncbi:MAG TPA: hypothetical protein VMT53_23820 [Terriglobales bacterium]|nr:hypothetical protein [Terriglobales bacterium]